MDLSPTMTAQIYAAAKVIISGSTTEDVAMGVMHVVIALHRLGYDEAYLTSLQCVDISAHCNLDFAVDLAALSTKDWRARYEPQKRTARNLTTEVRFVLDDASFTVFPNGEAT